MERRGEGPGYWGLGPGEKDLVLGAGIWGEGPGYWVLGPGERDQGRGTRGEGPGCCKPGPRTWVLGPGMWNPEPRT